MKISLLKLFVSTQSKIWQRELSGALALKLAIAADQINKHLKLREDGINSVNAEYSASSKEDLASGKVPGYLDKIKEINEIEVEINCPKISLAQIESLPSVSAADLAPIMWLIEE